MYSDAVRERFWAKVDVKGAEECWLWGSTKDRDGYGRFYMGRKRFKAHRISFELTFGDFDKKLLVLHRCDTPACVNPVHLFLGTDADNMRDRDAKNRQARMCGETNPMSKLTREQVLAIRESNASQRAIAAEFNIAQQSVSRIKRYERWAHVI